MFLGCNVEDSHFSVNRSQQAIFSLWWESSHYTGFSVHSGCFNKNIHTPGSLNKQAFISHSAGGWKSKIKFWKIHSGWGPTSSFIDGCLLVSLCGRRSEAALSGVSFIKGHLSHHEGSTLMTQLPSKGPLLILSHWELGFDTWILGGCI